jgi:DNA primase
VIGAYSASSPDVGLPLDLIQGRRVVLALDGDRAGEEACAKIAAAVQGVASELIRERPPEKSKDWLDALNGGAS